MAANDELEKNVCRIDWNQMLWLVKHYELIALSKISGSAKYSCWLEPSEPNLIHSEGFEYKGSVIFIEGKVFNQVLFQYVLEVIDVGSSGECHLVLRIPGFEFHLSSLFLVLHHWGRFDKLSVILVNVERLKVLEKLVLSRVSLNMAPSCKSVKERCLDS